MIAIFDSSAGGGEFGMDVARGVWAEVSDLHEAARQDVQKKAAHEFQGREPTDFLVALAEDDLGQGRLGLCARHGLSSAPSR
jgi:hypothetical protein